MPLLASPQAYADYNDRMDLKVPLLFSHTRFPLYPPLVQAYADYNDMMDLTERIIRTCAQVRSAGVVGRMLRLGSGERTLGGAAALRPLCTCAQECPCP